MGNTEGQTPYCTIIAFDTLSSAFDSFDLLSWVLVVTGLFLTSGSFAP